MIACCKTSLFCWFKICFISALIQASPLYSQDYYFKRYLVENGLSYNSVFSCVQDQNGFIWLGTMDGLNRFDGSTFKIFRNIAQDSTSLGNNYITALHVDQSGRLWVGTQRGLFLYNPMWENFRRIKLTESKWVRDIKSDGRNQVYFILDSSFYRYQNESNNIVPIDIKGNANFTSISTYASNLCLGTNDGHLILLNDRGHIISAFDAFKHSSSSQNKRIEKVCYLDSTHVLVGAQGQGVKLINTISGQYEDLLTHNADGTNIYVRDILVRSRGECWIGTESGLFILNLHSGTSTHLEKENTNRYSISDNAIYSLCQDRGGGIWVGTYFGGVDFYSTQTSLFKKYLPGLSANSIRGEVVREMVKDTAGNLWIGTEDGGLNKLNLKSGRVKNFMPVQSKGTICYSNIHGLIIRENKLWVGTFEHGIDIIDLKTELVKKHYGTENSSLASNFIITFYQTHAGDLLVGTYKGLYRYEPHKDDFVRIDNIPPTCFVYSIIEDYTGTTWIGSMGQGLFTLSPGTRPESVSHAINDRIFSKRVLGFFEDSRKNLWFMTGGDGIFRLDQDRKTWNQYTTKDGLSSDFVFRMQEDQLQNLWISTSKGLNRFIPAKNTFQNFTENNGLLTDQFNFNSSFKDERGYLFFGSIKGLISFNPYVFVDQYEVRKPILTGFQINNDEVPIQKNIPPLEQSISFARKIVLTYKQFPFSLNFSTLQFGTLNTTEYEYKIDGLHNRWFSQKSNHKITFAALSPGTYTLLIRTVSGTLPTPTAMLSIEVLPPFWASIYAFILYGLVVTLIVYAFIKNYFNKIQERNKRRLEILKYEKEKELYHAKMDFFTYVAHEIKTPLTLILAPMQKIISQNINRPKVKKNLAIMEKNTNRLLTLTNQLLDYRQAEINGFSLRFEAHNITSLVEDVFLLFKPLADEKEIIYTFNKPAEALWAYIDAEAFHKIVSNMCSNAIKYCKSTVIIYMNCYKDKNSFCLTIENDGEVINCSLKDKIFEPFYRLDSKNQEPGTGIGLTLCKLLAELHKGTIVLENLGGQTNVFRLTLPINRDTN